MHLFRNVIKRLKENGHQVTVLAKELPVLNSLLLDAGIDFISQGKKGKGFADKLIKQLLFAWQAYSLYRRHRFQLGVGISVTLPLLSRIAAMQAIVLDDDDKKATPQFAFLAHRHAAALLRPAALSHEGDRNNTVYYNGYHELAYLHPGIFSPDASVLEEQGLSQGETFFIVRLVAFSAHHDTGIRGISSTQMQALVSLLRPYGRIIVTHENQRVEFQGTESLKIHPARLHHLMAFAKLIVSDGQTMCSEAACLGVPSIRINDFVGRISTLAQIEEKWQLTFGFKPGNFEKALEKAQELLSEPADTFLRRRNDMLASCIHVTDFLLWFIENWPHSLRIAKQNPGFPNRFK